MSPDKVVVAIRSRLRDLHEDIARARAFLIKQTSGHAENPVAWTYSAHRPKQVIVASSKCFVCSHK